MMLRDVHYVIEAHFVMTDQANPSDNPGKFQDIVKRRLRSGQAYMQPYLGCRECTAHFRLWDGGEIPTIDETRDLGYMLLIWIIPTRKTYNRCSSGRRWCMA